MALPPTCHTYYKILSPYRPRYFSLNIPQKDMLDGKRVQIYVGLFSGSLYGVAPYNILVENYWGGKGAFANGSGGILNPGITCQIYEDNKTVDADAHFHVLFNKTLNKEYLIAQIKVCKFSA
jgi:hypothetical protein